MNPSSGSETLPQQQRGQLLELDKVAQINRATGGVTALLEMKHVQRVLERENVAEEGQ